MRATITGQRRPGESALTRLKLFLRDRSASTAIEYGLVAALVLVACVGGLKQMGGSASGLYAKIQAAIVGAPG